MPKESNNSQERAININVQDKYQVGRNRKNNKQLRKNWKTSMCEINIKSGETEKIIKNWEKTEKQLFKHCEEPRINLWEREGKYKRTRIIREIR